MRKLYYLLTLLFTTALTGCGDSDTLNQVNLPDPTLPPPTALASLDLLTSVPTLNSDGTTNAMISALVRDDSNNFVEGVTVIFSADSGGLANIQGTTDTSGVASAELSTAGDPTNRTITVTATAETLTTTVTVDVVGTSLTITGPGSLAAGANADYTIVLTDAAGTGIANRQVDLSTSAGSTLNPAGPLTTDAQGQASVNLTASATETLTASALGLQATQDILVSSDVLRFDTPTAGTFVNLGATQTVTVTSLPGGAALPGENITFSTTRGTLSAAVATTNGAGAATISISSNNAGPATITASTAAGLTVQLPIEFVATEAASVEMQASPFVVGPNEQSTITAIVRDAANNLVRDKLVTFSLQDTTNGQLSVGSALTDGQGRATTFYTASNTTSANDGVIITGSVTEGAMTISDDVNLTVARRELFISLGTGNQIEEPNIAQYRLVYAVQITDAQGAGVPDVTVQLAILSDRYSKGFYVAGAQSWIRQVVHTCDDEDINRNGILDPGEDFNNSGQLEAGNIATVAPGTVTTDANGFALVEVTYPQEFGGWVDVTLTASTTVAGTEFAEANSFTLSLSAEDINDLNASPPGQPSPFGDGTNDCTVPN